MENKHYVIQMKIGEHGKWRTLDHEYPTLVDARTAMDRKQKEGLPFVKWRIAESYVVVRYKAVKT